MSDYVPFIWPEALEDGDGAVIEPEGVEDRSFMNDEDNGFLEYGQEGWEG